MSMHPADPPPAAPSLAQVLVCQTAPSVRVSIGEEVGLAPGAVSTGQVCIEDTFQSPVCTMPRPSPSLSPLFHAQRLKVFHIYDSIDVQMVTAQRMLGFDYIFDSNWSADLTICEEGGFLLQLLVRCCVCAHLHSPVDGAGHNKQLFFSGQISNVGLGNLTSAAGTELLQRLAHAWKGGSSEATVSVGSESGHHLPGPLPMFTSCCPAWINLVGQNLQSSAVLTLSVMGQLCRSAASAKQLCQPASGSLTLLPRSRSRTLSCCLTSLPARVPR